MLAPATRGRMTKSNSSGPYYLPELSCCSTPVLFPAQFAAASGPAIKPFFAEGVDLFRVAGSLWL